MSSEKGTTIEYIDGESQSQGCLIVRHAKDHIGLCISLKEDGDIETFLGKEEVEKLILALQQAIDGVVVEFA